MDEMQTPLERRLAAPMFVMSLLFLTCLSGVLHVHSSFAFPQGLAFFAWGLAILYPVFIVEQLLHARRGQASWKRCLLYALVPPFRLGARDHRTGETMWLPVMGWVKVNRELRARVEKGATVPMIIVALLVLPLLALDFFWAERVENEALPQLASHAGAGMIWLAFTFEFIIMISIVKEKGKYCKEHWIDIAVIFLPLIAFLRAARLGRLMRLQQLSKTARVYRMRGLLMRLWRALLLLDAIDRLIRGTPEKQITKLRVALATKERELEELRAEIARLETIVTKDTPAPPKLSAAA
jgi:voltage-gated potassium channel